MTNSPDRRARSMLHTAENCRFTGKINWVQLDLRDDDHDHLIDADERFGIAMAKQ
jgi:hypothetical protein